MAGSEGVGQTDLLSGWSCVVHQPSEDPEPSELPSTVDMAAFSSGLGEEPVNNANNENSTESESETDTDSNNSGSDVTGSCSQSESSDSDSSSSSMGSSSSSELPKFSVTSSQTNGLRLTIASVRKSCSTPVEKPVKTAKASDKSLPAAEKQSTCNLSSSSSKSETGSDSESDVKSDNLGSKCVKKSDSKDAKAPPVSKMRTRLQDKKCDKKKEVNVSPKNLRNKAKQRKTKMASLPLSRGSTCTSSDSEDSDADSVMLAACSLQEIRQEDLAAILPDQQECDGFGGFECRNDKTAAQAAGDGSGSDMELPQQAVNALIQRTTESSSEEESPHPPLNPNTLCANSLLQQFVAQTQMLNTPTVGQSSSQGGGDANESSVNEANDTKASSSKESLKRKRGRPRKLQTNSTSAKSQKNPLNSLMNAEYAGDPDVSPDSGIQNSPDHRVSSPESSPLPNKPNRPEKTAPDRKQKDAKNSASTSATNKAKSQNKSPMTSNRFDRVLYANADRVLYPPRRKAGRPPIVRKGPGRPPKHKPTAQQPEVKKENSAPNVDKSDSKVKSKKIKRNNYDKDVKQLTSTTHNLSLGKNSKEAKKSKSNLLYEICERVSKRLELNTKGSNNNKKDTAEKTDNAHRSKSKPKKVLPTKSKLDRAKAKFTTLKNAKLMHSKHKHRKHKKCKFKILKPIQQASNPDPKINTEIEKLIVDFVKQCYISNNKITKENAPDVLKALKKVSKKRKNSDNSERKKKKQNVIAIIDKETNNEQRLPLKKRHYHLSNSEHKDEPDNLKQSETKIESSNKSKTNLINNKVPLNHEKPKTVASNKCSAQSVISKPPDAVPKSNNQVLKSVAVVKSLSPKAAPNLNNNEYELSLKEESIDTHIDEAIEACISRYSDKNKVVDNHASVKAENACGNTITTTPKKRHRLEATPITENADLKAAVNDNALKDKSPLDNVVSELKMKRNLSSKFIEQKKPEGGSTSAYIMTRKKNRLEDLTLNLVTKISNANESLLDGTHNKRKKLEVETEPLSRASVIKYPPNKKPKPETPTVETKVASELSGIFTPTVDLDLPQSSSAANEPKALEAEPAKEKVKEPKAESAPVNAPIKTELAPKRKVRKRRAINRTGFPTIKRKKKKVVVPPQTVIQESQNVAQKDCDDRVPRLGEEYSTFVERTEKLPLQLAAEKTSPSVLEEVSKWEDMSECDSLPQEERTDFEVNENGTDQQKSGDFATNVSVKSENSSTQDLDELSLEARIARMRKKNQHKLREKLFTTRKTELLSRRRFRDISPASSVEKVKEEYSLSGDEIKRSKKPPRWRKKYLVAGLFSDYYKEDDETARLRRQENITAKSRLVYNPKEHPYGLLPPPYHCGKYVRCRKVPFQIPYDLWWQHTHSQLPGRDLVPSWNYKKVRTNVYNVKLTTGACEPQACNCSAQAGCGDDCINRLVLAECPANHKCQNQKIQRHEWAPGLEKFMTENKGWGVRTNLPIKQSEFILEYVGEVVSDQEFKERMATRYINDTHHYCLHLDGGLVIDGHRMGGDGRFVNHSCQPNCEMQKWSVNGQFRMALFALRNIEGGEELAYDYNFSLFNPADGQQCMCGSENCRGVIGGKSQRVRPQPPIVQSNPGRVGRPRKNLAKRTHTNGASKEQPIPAVSAALMPVPPIKPLSNAQKAYILEHHCFLLRNLNKVKKLRERPINTVTTARTQTATPTDNSAAFLSHLNALQKPRNMKTRRLAQAEDDPELQKTAKLASLLKDLLKCMLNAKDEKGGQLCLPLITVPSKRKQPDYYQRIANPIDLTIIEQNVTSGVYKTAENFDQDMNRLFANTVRFYGRASEPGIASTRLKKIYGDIKREASIKFEDELGVKPPPAFVAKKNKGDEEDVIRCICGMYHDEGLMIQCERCLVWQHCECVQADSSAASYHCEKCVPREVDYEIPMNEYTEHGHKYYMTLLRGNLQLRQGDAVYVLRDIPIPGTNKKHTYETIGKIEYTELDIFRIERLWKDSETGQRFAYGHHYLRPHETYHEPSRKFFPNEVMRVPLYEAVPVELIIRHCWVLDMNTFCRGRPIEAAEEHIYICDFRVDKTARLFSKALKSKSQFQTCMKSYAFEMFDTRIKVSRTYTPHDLNPAYIKPRGRKPIDSEEVRNLNPLPVPVPRSRSEQKTRLNKILLNLLSKLPTKQVLDVSYLLEAGRRRKKPT